MYLLAVSGGVDSMFLLSSYVNKDIVVAHVNYNLRESSKRDQKIVENFCASNGIKLEVLNVTTEPVGNVELWAREIRYNFFKELYDKYECSKLIVGHHKDDFLETALMQQFSKRTPRYFGIHRKTKRLGMNIYRPLIDMYWKKEIIALVKKANIPYGEDETNEDMTFTRNRFRASLKQITFEEKRSQYSWFVMSNKILKKKFKKVDSWVNKWKRTNLSIDFFKKAVKFKPEVIFELLHEKMEHIKLSKSKINSIIEFIEATDSSKKYILSSDSYLFKSDGLLKMFYPENTSNS